MLALSVKVQFEEGHIFSLTLLFLHIATDASVKRNARNLWLEIYLPAFIRLFNNCKTLTGAAVCLKI